MFLSYFLLTRDLAGVPMEHVLGTNTSVFVGNCSSEYYSMNSHDSECHPQYIASGSSTSMFANRLSWFYDLRGPSVALDTACSSSLVGLHLGCQSLLHGEAEMVCSYSFPPLLNHRILDLG